jgi:hypothetical protein
MAMITTPAVTKPRATTWLVASHSSDGARAPVAVSTQAIVAVASSTPRRPRRSASATSTTVMTTSARTTASASPWAALPASNSSAANVTVWVRIVPM